MKGMKKGRLLLLAGAAALILGALGLLCWRYYPVVQGLLEPAQMDAFRETLQSLGAAGALALGALQFLQTVSGVIPALPIQLAAGLTYGPVGGLCICLVGIGLGSTVVFLAVKRLGQPLVDRVFPREKQQKLSFLRDSRRLEGAVVILYLIPALPKDVFTYLAALTPLSFRRFLLLSMAARVPMIFCDTFAAGALMAGDYRVAAAAFGVACLAGLGGMLCAPRVLRFLRRRQG